MGNSDPIRKRIRKRRMVRARARARRESDGEIVSAVVKQRGNMTRGQIMTETTGRSGDKINTQSADDAPLAFPCCVSSQVHLRGVLARFCARRRRAEEYYARYRRTHTHTHRYVRAGTRMTRRGGRGVHNWTSSTVVVGKRVICRPVRLFNDSMMVRFEMITSREKKESPIVRRKLVARSAGIRELWITDSRETADPLEGSNRARARCFMSQG